MMAGDMGSGANGLAVRNEGGAAQGGLSNEIDAIKGRDASVDRANQPMTSADIDVYLQTGKKQSTRNEKSRMMESGDTPVLKNKAEVSSFIKGAISGERKNKIKAFAKVGERLANAVLEKSNGGIDITGMYMELSSDDLRHSYLEHSFPKEPGDIALSEANYFSIPEYLNSFDDIIYAQKIPNIGNRIQIGKIINGYSIITEIVSNERSSIRTRNMWDVDTEKYLRKYKKRSSSNRVESNITADSSNNPSAELLLKSTYHKIQPVSIPVYPILHRK